MLGRGQAPAGIAAAVSSAKGLRPLGSTSPFLPALPGDGDERNYPKQVFTGKSLDQVYGKNHDELMKLQDENKQLKAEVTQIKTLNEKLSEKAEYLQSIIDKEASANTYYFNYPPKAEGAEAKPGKPASDSEATKVKKMYEDQMELQRKQYEGQLKALK